MAGHEPSLPFADRWHRVERLFDAALLVPTEARPAWLDSRDEEPALVAEVRRMLDALDHSGPLDRVLRPAPALSSEALRGRLDRALTGQYSIVRELGRGGMATVFLAQERKHERPVVLKVLNPDIGAWWGGARFAREVQIAARLAHPHIVPLIDSGRADGLLYYVMAYVEGESLRARLARTSPLPIPQTLRLLRDIADALDHAHGAGIVHRDLKPENVLCAGDHAYLLDFGIAKLVLPGDRHTGGLATAVGTPAYMAPEQARGDPLVDGRADLWAWGVLAHEMLTGRLPERRTEGDTPMELAALRRPGVPRTLVELVESCLCPEPDGRPTQAAVLVTQLGRIGAGEDARGAWRARRVPRRAAWMAALLLATVALAGGLVMPRLRRPPTARGALPGPVAVAAFVNETGDPALDAWGRLAGDWITQGLQQTRLAGVVPWPSALQASERLRRERASGGGGDPVKLLREETGAGTLVTGAYYLVSDSLQFRAMVTDAQLGTLLEAPPPVTVSRDSAAQAIRMLRERVLGALAVRRDAGATPQPDLGAAPPTYEAYRAFDAAIARFLEQDYAAAAPALLAAHRLDTTFNAPLLYAASAYWNLRDYATTASLVTRLREPGRSLSAYERDATEYLDAALAGEGERALAAIRRAADEAPGSRAHYIFATAALEMDRPREALEALRHVDPDRGVMRGWSSYWTQLAHAYHLLGDHARELQAARELRRRFPDRRVAWVLEARALAAMGNVAALDSLMEAQRSLPPTTYWSQGAAMVDAGEELRAHGFPDAGRAFLERSRRWLEGELAVNPRDRTHREWLAYALYGERRWAEAERIWSALAVEFPDRVRYRGNAALCAAHLGRPGVERRLVPRHPVERGTITYYRGIVAAIHGEPNRATSLLADAVRLGVDGLPWLHASSHDDLALLATVRGALPQSLRTGSSPGILGVP